MAGDRGALGEADGVGADAADDLGILRDDRTHQRGEHRRPAQNGDVVGDHLFGADSGAVALIAEGAGIGVVAARAGGIEAVVRRLVAGVGALRSTGAGIAGVTGAIDRGAGIGAVAEEVVVARRAIGIGGAGR